MVKVESEGTIKQTHLYFIYALLLKASKDCPM